MAPAEASASTPRMAAPAMELLRTAFLMAEIEFYDLDQNDSKLLRLIIWSLFVIDRNDWFENSVFNG